MERRDIAATITHDTTTQAPTNGGLSSLKVVANGAGSVYVQSGGVFDWTGNGYYPTLQAGHTYRLEAWMKQTGIPTGKVTLNVTQHYNNASTHVTYGRQRMWTKYSYDFVASMRGTCGGEPVSSAAFSFTGGGTLWIDNYVLYDTSYPLYAPNAPNEQAAFAAFQARFHADLQRMDDGQHGAVDGQLAQPARRQRPNVGREQRSESAGCVPPA